MQKDRFWFGASLVVAPMLFCLMLMMPRNETRRGEPLEGQVKIHGRPMAGGFIVFVPDDPKVNTVIGSIDDEGHYRIETRWLREDAESQTHFRICLFPKPSGHVQAVEIDGEPAGHPEAEAGAEHQGPKSITKVASDWPRRLTDPRTSDLEVEIDPESTRVDITL